MSDAAVDAVEQVLRARVLTSRGGPTRQLAWDIVQAAEHARGPARQADHAEALARCRQENEVLRASWVDAVDEQASRLEKIITDLARGVDDYLAAEFPRGTSHPADRAGARLRAFVEQARTRLAEEQEQT